MSDVPTTAGNRRQKWILIGLVALFLAPIVGSYVLFNFTSLGQGGGGASYGDLIQPPRQLPDQALTPISGSETTGHLYGKWSLVYLVDGACDRDCEQNLYRMRQLRLAQGKHGTRVQRVLINFGEARLQFGDRIKQEYAGQWILRPDEAAGLLAQFRLVEGDEPLPAQRLYLVDPRGFLMMSYAPGTDPGGIIDDMKRLLRYSRVG
jgi:hypothetical protein